MDDSKNESLDTLSDQAKVISLFQFIEELNKLKQKAILNIREYPWSVPFSDIPIDSENIILHYPDRVAEKTASENEDEAELLLSVHKPEFQKCPEPELSFELWLKPGWEDFRQEASVIPSMPGKQADSDTGTSADISFSDDPLREKQYQQWLQLRKTWQESQFLTERTRNLFTDLYRLYFELKRKSETEEMIAANGFLCDRTHPEICHPVITHRVRIDYNADTNIVSVYNTQIPSDLYSVVFQVMDDINLGEINTLSEDLKKNDYHPLDRNETPGFLKVFVHQLSSDSTYSDSGIPVNWEKNSRLLLYWNPCFIVRKRLDGTLKAIEQIIENVRQTGDVPGPIRDIVSGGIMDLPEETEEASIEEQLAAVGGESVDILLSKQANKEQLNIARRIEQYNAVLVQGPPGTGKTHTIANLLGHFLAQGKNVLVTSYTTKALRVLKDKVSPGLQNLCVSMLDDSNIDMERSVNGITDYMSQTTSGDVRREMSTLAEERKAIISRLADVRRKLYTMIQQECSCIVYNGEEISPSAAARFVTDHEDDLSYIPGTVHIPSPLPLSFEQLAVLYRSNENLTQEDEQELECEIPSPQELLSPGDFEQTVKQLSISQTLIDNIAAKNNWTIVRLDAYAVDISGDFGSITLSQPPIDEVRELRDHIHSIGKPEKWMQQAAVDGKSGGAYRQRWQTLIAQIQGVCRYSESVIAEQFGQDIEISNFTALTEQKATLETIRAILAEKGKISKLTLMLHKEFGTVLESAKINGHSLQTPQDCDLILHRIELQCLREKCARFWDSLMSVSDIPAFFELDREKPETVADNWIPLIERALDWYQSDFTLLLDKMSQIGIMPKHLSMTLPPQPSNH